MFSERFQKEVRLTFHAQQRMVERDIGEETIKDLIETGTLKVKDERRWWIFKHYTERDDNLLCVAVANEDDLVVKTLMTHWQEIEL